MQASRLTPIVIGLLCLTLFACGTAQESTVASSRSSVLRPKPAALQVLFRPSTGISTLFPENALNALMNEPNALRLMREVSGKNGAIQGGGYVFLVRPQASLDAIDEFVTVLRHTENVASVDELQKNPCSATPSPCKL